MSCMPTAIISCIPHACMNLLITQELYYYEFASPWKQCTSTAGTQGNDILSGHELHVQYCIGTFSALYAPCLRSGLTAAPPALGPGPDCPSGADLAVGADTRAKVGCPAAAAVDGAAERTAACAKFGL